MRGLAHSVHGHATVKFEGSIFTSFFVCMYIYTYQVRNEDVRRELELKGVSDECVSLGHFCLAQCSFGPPSCALVVLTWSGEGCGYMMWLG